LRIFSGFGVKTEHVIDAINRPDAFQHLLTEAQGERNLPSLFMKFVHSNREPFWTLVQAHRVGRTQVVHAAWRLYPAENRFG
jgi:hypothetical protein